jgi:hypothetical protein
MEILNIDSKKGPLSIQWSNKHNLAHYATMQAGCYFGDISAVDWNSPCRFMPLHYKHFQQWNQTRWDEREQMSVFDIPSNSKIIDIGCGVSITDLLLYSYIPSSSFYLVDKNGEWPNGLYPPSVSFTENHPHYNSWDTVVDAINTSNFDRNRFNMLSPADAFPKDVDLIMSSFSWCFHYPKETYWSQTQASLKTGGKLFLDVRLLADRDVIGEISEEFKNDPLIVKIPALPDYLDNQPLEGNDTIGYRCLWTKKT